METERGPRVCLTVDDNYEMHFVAMGEGGAENNDRYILSTVMRLIIINDRVNL